MLQRALPIAPVADRAGIAVSTLCAVHCLAGAVLAGASSLAPALLDRRVELALAGSAVAIASIALGRAFGRHRRPAPMAVAAFGIACLLAARFVRTDVEAIEVALSIVGGLLLVTAHVINLRACRRANACCGPVT